MSSRTAEGALLLPDLEAISDDSKQDLVSFFSLRHKMLSQAWEGSLATMVLSECGMYSEIQFGCSPAMR